jgi:predicted nucleic acid-binding protein
MVSGTLVGQRVYVDSSALIYAIEVPDQYPGLKSRVFIPFSRGELTLVTSWITYAEVLVRPMRLGDSVLVVAYQQFFQASPVLEIMRVDQRISEQASRLRAIHGLKLPDAIHIASGQAARCTSYLTGDSQWAQTGVTVIDPAQL